MGDSLPVAEGCPGTVADPVSIALDTGIGTTVTVERGADDEYAVPVPVGPLMPVELPKP